MDENNTSRLGFALIGLIGLALVAFAMKDMFIQAPATGNHIAEHRRLDF